MTDKAAWQGQVGDTWASEWIRTDRSFAALTERLLAIAGAAPIGRALDVGCGAGELSLALARGNPSAEIIGLDVSEALVERARQRGAQLPNVAFECGDAATWDRAGWHADLVISRHGVMFFDQPAAAFAHLAQVGGPGCRLVFSCFRSPAENPWASDVVALLPGGAPIAAGDPAVPGPFAFADAVRVQQLLAEAGWGAICIDPVDFAFVVGSGPDPVADAMGYFARIGPAARAAAALGDAERSLFDQRLRRYLERHVSGSIVALSAAAWIVTARI
ncbi:class I SAM-dependent methyltransferase [Parerythrobacter aurantius]|uniref:class I SAM-dependent methyltransferase n=1 Tax=Parerythrobacter aurantius TaxID=3127706 RepID=UPI00324A6A41